MGTKEIKGRLQERKKDFLFLLRVKEVKENKKTNQK